MEGSHAVVAEFVAGLVPDSPVAPVTTPEDLAALGAGLTSGAVGWAVALGRRCSDATRVSQGEHAAQLTEDDTRQAIEGSMLSLLRRLCGDDSGAVLNEWQLTLARTMARLDWPYERYVLGLRLAQDMALEALLDRAVHWGRAGARPALLLAVTHGVAGYFDDSVRAAISEFIAERRQVFRRCHRGDGGVGHQAGDELCHCRVSSLHSARLYEPYEARIKHRHPARSRPPASSAVT